jgi:alanine racemase
MARPIRALLSADALRDNLSRVRDFAPDARVMAVVKADAYGHGLAWAAGILGEADAFGVASVEEGTALRAAGVRQPICLLEGFFDAEELPAIVKAQLSPAVHHKSQLWDLENTPGLAGLDVWLKVDTGMHRLGFVPEAAVDAAQRLSKLPGLGRLRLLSHLANADNRFDAATPMQIDRFLQLAAELGGEVVGERSLANSAGIVAWPASHFDWVRPGIMLYGGAPLIGQPARELGLKPVMTLETELIAVNQRRKGELIGYGGDWACPEDMPVGVAAAGYGDGYPRHAPAGTPVLVNGRRAGLIGRVSMDMITVDLRGVRDPRVGDRVVLWGEELPVDEIAAAAGTISYELLCRVTARVPRVEVRAP